MRTTLTRYGDLIVTLVIFGIGLTLMLLTLFTSALIPSTSARVAAAQLGPKFWPLFILIGIVGLCAVLIIRQLKNLKNAEWNEENEATLFATYTDNRLISLMGLTVLYVFLLQYLGFTLVTPFYLFIFCWLIGISQLAKNIIFSIVLTGILVYLFGRFLYVPLPRGVGILRELSFFLY